MGSRSSSPTSAHYINNEQRRGRAIQLRLAGASFDEIAHELGYVDRAAAYRAIRLGVERVSREHAEELFDVDMARLDKLLAAIWDQAMLGDLNSVDRVLKILERRAKMLGYDSVQITNRTQVDSTATHDRTSLADVLGTEAGDLEQRMARVLHEALPAVIDQPTGSEGGEDRDG